MAMESRCGKTGPNTKVDGKITCSKERENFSTPMEICIMASGRRTISVGKENIYMRMEPSIPENG